MAPLSFRMELEGLRGLLMLLIAFYHAGASLFSSSFFSVDAFFVVSGYLMACIISAELREGRFTLFGFYERRARRLLPALYVVLFVGIILAYFILPPIDYETLAESSLWALGMAGNVFFAESGAGYFSSSISLQPFMHLWSLGLEQQYYLLIPLVFLLFSKADRPWLSVVMLGLCLTSLYLAFTMAAGENSARAYYIFSARVWEFLLGGLVALHQLQLRQLVSEKAYRWLADLGLLLLLGTCFLASEHSLHPGPMTLLPVVGVLMLLVFAVDSSIAVRVLCWTPLVWLGGLSYSLYLWHQVMLSFGRWLFMDNFGLLIAIVLLALSLGLSLVTCRFIEEPFRSAKRVSRGKFWGGLICSTLLVFSVANYVNNKHGLRDRLPKAFVDETVEQSGYVVSVTLDGVDCRARIMAGDICELGAPGAERRWVLIGDSHASQLAGALDRVFRRAGVAGYLVARHSCGYAIGVRLVGDHEGLCEAHNASVRQWMLSQPDIQNVIIAERSAYYYSKQRYSNGSGASEGGPKRWFEPYQSVPSEGYESAVLKAMVDPIDELLKSGRHVALVYPTPEFGWDVPRYFFRQVMRGQEVIDISIKSSIYEERVAPFKRVVREMLGDSGNLTLVDPSDVFCDGSVCRAYQNGRLLYQDDDHLTRYGAERVAEKIAEAVGLDSLSNRIVTRF